MIDGEFRNPMDALVVSNIRHLMGDTSIGINDNFFGLGGDSLVAVRFGQALGEELGITRVTHIILKNPVLGDLSAALSDLTGERKSRSD
jgi:acyl carrier protein